MGASPGAPAGAGAFLGVGSSLDPLENIPAALGLLLGTPGIRITGISTIYRTPPLPAPGASAESVARDPDFLNGVVAIRTSLTPEELTEVLGTIEKALGRVRTENKYAPRTLDVDLLVYRAPGPAEHPVHRDVLTRPWVAIPLLELAPDLSLPQGHGPLKQVADRFPHAGGVVEEAFTRELRRRFLTDSPESEA